MKPHPIDDLDPKLAARLTSLQGVPPRDEHAAQATRQRYLTQLAEMRPVHQRVSWLEKVRHIVWKAPITVFQKENRMIATLSGILTILVLLVGGAGATVAAAQGSLPDQPLYPVKTFTEEINLALSPDPANDIALLEQYTARRFDEIQQLIEAGLPLSEQAELQLQRTLNQYNEQSLQLDDPALVQTMTQLQSMLQTRTQLMLKLAGERLEEPVMLRIQTMLQTQLQLMQGGLEDPVLLRSRLMQAGNGNADAPVMTPDAGYGPNPEPGPQDEPGYGPNPTAQPGPGEPGDGAGPGTPPEDPEGNGPGQHNQNGDDNGQNGDGQNGDGQNGSDQNGGSSQGGGSTGGSGGGK